MHRTAHMDRMARMGPMGRTGHMDHTDRMDRMAATGATGRTARMAAMAAMDRTGVTGHMGRGEISGVRGEGQTGDFMTGIKPMGKKSAVDGVALRAAWSSLRSRRSPSAVALLAVLSLFAFTSRATADVVTNGPAYAGTGGTPESGATCSVSPALSGTQGPNISLETVTCSTVSQSAVIYFGLRNDQFVVGDMMNGGTGPNVAAGNKYAILSTTSNSITYSGTTTVPDQIGAGQSGNPSCGASCTATTQLVLTLTSVTGGTGTVTAVSGNPNADIGDLFLITGTQFTVTVAAQAKYPNNTTFGFSVPQVFNPAHVNTDGSPNTNRDVNRVDLGFY